MSYILDALKKLEKEKGRKSGPGGMVNISGDLFVDDSPRAVERPPRLGITLLVLAVAAMACGATYWFLKPERRSVHRQEVPATSAVVKPPAAPAVVTAPVVSMPAAAVPPVVTPAVPAPAAPPVASVPAAVGETAPAEAGSTRTRRVAKVVPKPREEVVRNTVQLPVAKIPPPADIKVLGVAWQEERSARRAVINGFLMKEGGVVSGARITEILTDKVRFLSSAGSFEVPMVSSGFSPSGK